MLFRSRWLMSRTSASIGYWFLCFNAVKENYELTTNFPPFIKLPSPCFTLMLFARFQTPIHLAILGPTTGAVAPGSITASTFMLAILMFTVSRGEWRGLRPTARPPPSLFPPQNIGLLFLRQVGHPPFFAVFCSLILVGVISLSILSSSH